MGEIRIGLSGKDSSEFDSIHFNSALEEALTHIELVFHRILSGEMGAGRVAMFLNKRPLKGFDPFHKSHPATIAEPLELIQVGSHRIEVQAYTLPHHSKVGRELWERYEGRGGYLKNQGFYVYRVRRLIIHGTWFGLVRQQELTKLSRVQIDMPRELDAEWKIDIKKSSAQLPSAVRNRLRRIIERVVRGSRRTYTARGTKLLTEDAMPVWNREQNKNEISYRLNPEHPIFADFKSRLPKELISNFAHVMNLCQSTLPLQTLYADMGNQPNYISVPSVPLETLKHLARTTVLRLSEAGLATKDIVEMLSVTEPYRSNWKKAEEYIQEAAAQEDWNGQSPE